MTLLADVNHPGSEEDLVSNWELAHNLVEDAVSGAKIAPCLLPFTHLPLCLWLGNGLVHSLLAVLWYSLNPLFCEQARLCLKLEIFTGKFSLSLSLSPSLSLSLFPPPHSDYRSLGYYLMLAPLNCPQGIQIQSLP